MRPLAFLFLLLAAPLRADPIVVFAASSLGGALEAVAEDFAGEVVMSYAGSATLARQIEAGAPADLVILANADWMDHLSDRGALAGPYEVILSNRLVLVVPEGAQTEATDPADPLAGLDRIATGFVGAVPLGIYTRQTLEALELWEDAAPRLVETENARLALALVARGDVAAGFVYQSDANAEPRVAVQAIMGRELHSPIRYTAGVTARAQAEAQAEAFLAHLSSPAAQAIFQAHGYEPPP